MTTPADVPDRGDLHIDPAAPVLPMLTGLRIAPTGVGEVDAAAARLSRLSDTDIHQHPAIYDEVHRALSVALDVAMGDQSA